ncbi:hypothetical protein J7E62_18225 [Variovorax paradoxus]|nr:hypothetical protein [Variovorax paradoxus]
MENLDDEQLAATAYVWRKRAMLGEKHAEGMARKLDAELRRRLGATPSRDAPLDTLPGSKSRPWWRFW